jgi:HlyD family secretion protein
VKNLTLLILFVCLAVLYSCTGDKPGNILTHTIVRTDFEDYIVTEGVAEPVITTNVICPDNIDGNIIFLVQDGARVETGDVICIIEDKNLQTEYDEAVTNLESAIAQLNKVKADLDMQYALLEADVKNNQAQTAIVMLDSLQLKYSTETMRKIRELELQKANVERRKLDMKLRTLQKIQASEIRKHELTIQRHRANMEARAKRLESLTLTSPGSGIVRRVFNRQTGKRYQEGDNVWTGRAVVTIPDLDQMKVQFMAPEGDYKRINMNDMVEFSFDAMPGNSGQGKIIKKAPVGTPVKRDSKVKFFEMEASVDSVVEPPAPGLSVSCRIILKVLKDTIVIPQITVFEEDSMKVVFVKKDKLFERRQVSTGLSSPTNIVITQGLRAGEIISMTRPDENQIISTPKSTGNE